MALLPVDLNYLAIVVVAIVNMIVGALWFSPLLFGKQWMTLMGFTSKKIEEMKKKGNMNKVYLIAFIMSLITSYVLAHFVDYLQATTISAGAQTGFWLWLGFVAPLMMNGVLWEDRPMKLYWINVFHQLVSLAIMGAVLAAWV